MSAPRVLLNMISRRSISTSTPLAGKRNFRKFQMLNKRGTTIEKQNRAARGEHDSRGVRMPGVKPPDSPFQFLPEMVPELIVPDLEGCELRPYVSYRAPDVIQSEYTAEDLFSAVYGQKIVNDFKASKLDEDGTPTEPSPQEKMTATEAFQNARKTGSDIF